MLQIRIYIHAVDTRSMVPVTFQPKVFLRSFSTTEKTILRSFRMFGYFFMLRSQNQTANQIRRSYKNGEFNWPFYLVTVT